MRAPRHGLELYPIYGKDGRLKFGLGDICARKESTRISYRGSVSHMGDGEQLNIESSHKPLGAKKQKLEKLSPMMPHGHIPEWVFENFRHQG